MAIATTNTYTSQSSYVHKVGLPVAKLNHCMGKFGRKFSIPDRSSLTIKFRRYNKIDPKSSMSGSVLTAAGSIASSTKAIAEGIVPATSNPAPTDYSLTLLQYGNLMKVSDLASRTTEVAPDAELIKRNAENMADTLDAVYRDGLQGGTNFGRLTNSVGAIGSGARTTVAGIINAAALNRIVTILEAMEAQYFASNTITASTGIGTSPVRPAYVAIIHPHVKHDLESIAGYKSTSDYGSQEGLFEGETGAYRNIRFVMSTISQRIFINSGAAPSGTISTGGAANDVYSVLVIAKDAYGTVDLDSSTDMTYIPARQKDSANPLGQWSTIGWTAVAGALILNDAWIYRMECAATAAT